MNDINRATVTTSDPLIRALTRRANHPYGDTTVEQLVLRHGVPFAGIDRLPGMRLGLIKNCYRNSYYAASKREGMLYVEGFAMVNDLPPFHHAWISPDGVQAIDLTLRHPSSSIHFFGIPFSIRLASEELIETDATLPLIDTWKPRSRLYALAEKAKEAMTEWSPPARDIQAAL